MPTHLRISRSRFTCGSFADLRIFQLLLTCILSQVSHHSKTRLCNRAMPSYITLVCEVRVGYSFLHNRPLGDLKLALDQ